MLFEISTTSDIPIYKQVRDQIIIGIAKGQLKPDEQLPSVRQLADEIGVNNMTISKAYNQLKDEGFLITDRRLGTKVAPFKPQPGPLPPDLFFQLTLILAEIRLHAVNTEQIEKSVQQILTDFFEE
ncbi:GntR family transcriptional regulator [Enterococcus sp. LJL90]